ncbi:MAG: TetR/AcrR family transcriptional regulator [Spirochaetales bacterium]|nr:TetR/AcrR family transcriptional regulator [Spirochaetales bacterium]
MRNAIKLDNPAFRVYIVTMGSCDFMVTWGGCMPKETFFNLPEEKRRLIENTAITEFASCGFDKASINIIVQNSRISKGSFYQYFTDKKDLFLHILISVIAEKKLAYLSPVLTNPEKHDFFTFIKELFISGLKFASENPELEKIGLWIMNNTNHPVYKELFKKTGNISMNIYKTIVSEAQSRGDFRDGVDGDFISHILPSLMTGSMDYCLKTSKKEGVTGLTGISDEIMETVDLMMEFIKEGIGNN